MLWSSCGRRARSWASNSRPGTPSLLSTPEAQRFHGLVDRCIEERERILRRVVAAGDSGSLAGLLGDGREDGIRGMGTRGEVLEEQLCAPVTPELVAEIAETEKMITAMLEQVIAERRARKEPDRWKDFHVTAVASAQTIVDRMWG